MSDPAWQHAVVAALCAAVRELDGAGGRASWTRIGGNARSSAWKLSVGTRRFFVKSADADSRDMLSAEADGLRTIAATRTVRVPDVLACGHAERAAFLALEWLDIVEGGRDGDLGRAVAAMHASTADRYGWYRDNTIGATPQANGWSEDWPVFFRDRRIAPQLALAAANGHGGTLQRSGEKLLALVPAILAGARPAPSLLHGDLWTGNAAALADGAPAVFDPAVYYGDPETDLAMTELFGGFTPEFYAAYRESMPLRSGYGIRRTLYNLYHVLNHLNLFGSAYRRQAQSMIDALVSAAT